MGNNTSSCDSASEDEISVVHKDVDGHTDDEIKTEKDGPTGYDLGLLFDHTSLQGAAAKIKDNVQDDILLQDRGSLLQWLRERQLRNEDVVTLSQFCDALLESSDVQGSVNYLRGCQVFNQFDSDGDGTAEVNCILDALKLPDKLGSCSELDSIVRMMQACALTPGFIDVYNEDKGNISQHGTKILNFLLHNRAPSALLPFSILNGFKNTTQMRLAALGNYLTKVTESATQHQEENIATYGEEKQQITKCHSRLQVSSNRADADRLVNGNSASYWQSNGVASSHWIRLKIKNNVVIRQLSITVNMCDQSYMPQLVTVAVGKNSSCMREVKEVRIPSHVTGDVVLFDNGKVFYPVIQINIQRCHSDGCDTRIHGVKTIGYRIVKEVGVSVLDASATWYLQVLTATATACIPTAPHLRETILQQSCMALKQMPPLSLSTAMGENLPFLSPSILQETDSFLWNIAADTTGQLCEKALHTVLAFNLARGHVAGILRTLLRLQESPNLRLESASLMKKLQPIRETCLRKQAMQLVVTLVGCDGGQKDSSSGTEDILAANWMNSRVYLTADGKTKVNMFFKGSDHVQLTKVRIKVDKGVRGPKRGMVFVYNDDREFSLSEHVEKFKSFDKANNKTLPGVWKTSFTVDDGWDEVEVGLDGYPCGQYILIKFLEPRQSTAERLGIMGIRFYGFQRNCVFLDQFSMDKVAPLDSDDVQVSSDTLFLRTLAFVAGLTRDQAERSQRGVTALRSQILDTSNVSLELLWKLYSGFEDGHAKMLCLNLLHALFPFLVTNKAGNKMTAEPFFSHLCSVIDNTENVDPQVTAVTKQVIIDGAAVFFPDNESRRKQLFNLMTDGNTTQEVPSVALTFQSLCQFFSNIDPSGLIDLTNDLHKNPDADSVLAVMETLVSVAQREFSKALTQHFVSEQSRHLVQLLCSLQTSLLSCCHHLMHADTSTNTQDKCVLAKQAENILVQYVSLLSDKGKQACDLLNEKPADSTPQLLNLLESSFLATAIRQMVLMLTQLCEDVTCMSRVKLLNSLLPLAQSLNSLAYHPEEQIYKTDPTEWQKSGKEDEVLRIWEVESEHDYENDQHITQVFYCPGATSFIVEFDPRCETENRYDYLEFTDAHGTRMRFNHKVGTDKWPSTVTFSKDNQLRFLFHSDLTNNEWGYKFKVTAKGMPDVPLSWMYDLHLSLSKLFGRLCGANMDLASVVPKLYSTQNTSTESDELIKSEIWSTLFRGGYTVGKLQRSFSGKHASEDQLSINAFLISMVTEKQGMAAKFLQRCQEHCPLKQMGNDSMTDVVTAVFAALLWHSQPLREEIEKYSKGSGDYKIADGIHQAYSLAAGIRPNLLEQKQKQILSSEKGEVTDNGAVLDPLTSCREKALFLLQFASLSKVQLKNELRPKAEKRNSRSLNKYYSYSGNKLVKMDVGTMEKYPSFHIVLDFVREVKWSKKQVEELIQQRTEHAQALAMTFNLLLQFIVAMGDDHIFQVINVQLFQELLRRQDHFGRHYADGLSGCGLELESRVRDAFYELIRHLVAAIRTTSKLKLSKCSLMCYDFIHTCTLHLLDITWRPYDLAFLVEINLPEFYLDTAKASVATRVKMLSKEDEEAEVKEYEKNMRWLEECRSGFSDWYASKHNDKAITPQDKKDMQMFLARFCDLLDVEINCDGCGVTLPGHRYRCLQCYDMDLCASCYAGGVQPGGQHSDDHHIVHLMYMCDQCKAFIVGTRIHCNVCVDFDLCLGCQNAGHYPSCHSAEHAVTSHRMIRLCLNKQADSYLQAYVHQHVWLLFSALALSVSTMLYQGDHQRHLAADPDYVRAATQLHGNCVRLVNECLTHSGTLDTSEPDSSNKSLQKQQEEAFAIHSQERIMGLLGAMIPVENKSPLADDVAAIFTSEEYLRLLFSIARGERGHEINVQHFAIGLIGQLLLQVTTSCKTVDNALDAVIEDEDKVGDSDDTTVTYVDKVVDSDDTTVSKGDKPDDSDDTTVIKSDKTDDSDDTTVTSGDDITVTTDDNADDSDDMTVTKCDKPDGYKTAEFLFSFGATCLERSGLEWANSMAGILQKLLNSPSWKEVLLEHISVAIHNLKKSPELSSIFALFVVAGFPEVLTVGCRVRYTKVGCETKAGIVLKHFPEKNQTLVVDEKSRKRRCLWLHKEDYVQCVTHDTQVLEEEHMTDFINVIKDIIADIKSGRDVSVERMWVLSLTLKGLQRTISVAGQPIRELFTSEFVQRIVFLASRETGFSALWLLKDLEVLSLTLYTREREMQGKGVECTVQACKSDDEVAPLDAEHPSGVTDDDTEPVASEIDTQSKSPEGTQKSAKKAVDWEEQLSSLPALGLRVFDSATPEPSEESQSLIASVDNDARNDIMKQRKNKSSALQRQQLEIQGKTGSRAFLLELNMAISVLYARQVLTALLADWPDAGHMITADLIGCEQIAYVPFVLDLLNTPDATESFQKVVQNIIKHCDPDDLVSIAMTSCRFMEEAIRSTVVKELANNSQQASWSIEETVHISGATYLTIKFDNRCCSEEETGELVMSSSSDYKQDRHMLTGSCDKWMNFDLPGDTLYYKFSSSSLASGYKFTVTGGYLRRFDTGYRILSGVLSMPKFVSKLPLSELWRSLVYICCRQVGRQRLKSTQLLINVMQTQTRESGNTKFSLELGLLQPLWTLYNEVFANQYCSIASSLVRAFTELFFVAENLAREWDVLTEYMVALHDVKDIHKVVFQGLQNVAAVCVMIGQQNSITASFETLRLQREAKQKQQAATVRGDTTKTRRNKQNTVNNTVKNSEGDEDDEEEEDDEDDLDDDTTTSPDDEENEDDDSDSDNVYRKANVINQCLV